MDTSFRIGTLHNKFCAHLFSLNRTRMPWECEQEEQGWRSGDCTRLANVSGLSWLLVLYSVLSSFSPGSPVFPSPQKSTFPNSNRPFQHTITWYNPPFWRATLLLFSHWKIKTKASQASLVQFFVSMFQCGNNNELALQHGGSCSMLSFVAKGLFDRLQYLP